MKARRLLLLSTSIARGGAERQVVDLAVALKARGWQVTVLSMIDPTDHHAELAEAGIELSSLSMTRGRPSLRALLRYARFVRRLRPTVVHSHMVHANLLARIGRLLVPSVPVVSTVHSVVEGARWREIAYRITDPLSSATTAVSEAATERYLQVGAVPRGRIVTIPNGVDIDRDLNPQVRAEMRARLGAVDAFLWLNVASLVPAKGHDMLLQAFQEVIREHPGTRLVIAGDGTERAGLLRLRQELGLTEVVAFLGERRDVPALLAAADAFVLSSRWEGLPVVLLEAAAQAVPIVSTDVGGCREVASLDAGGILTEPGPAGIAQGMLTAMGLSEAQRAEAGRLLRERVKARFGLANIADRWEELYAAVADGSDGL